MAKKSNKKNDKSFDSFLDEEGILDEVTANAETKTTDLNHQAMLDTLTRETIGYYRKGKDVYKVVIGYNEDTKQAHVLEHTKWGDNNLVAISDMSVYLTEQLRKK